ncbi:DUF6296 family protein [Streptomyces sp. NPDC087917]|uniref:DUF6296 family protein n=1 Tax=unclassified Streptomyces TaxID=2593676 RepID=UPI0034325AFF
MSVPRYELAFPDSTGTGRDLVVVDRTEERGPGGHPVYADASGIVRAEISDQGEVRMLTSSVHQVPAHPLGARPLS